MVICEELSCRHAQHYFADLPKALNLNRSATVRDYDLKVVGGERLLKALVASGTNVAVTLLNDFTSTNLACKVEHGFFELVKRNVEPGDLTDQSSVELLTVLYIRILLSEVHELFN